MPSEYYVFDTSALIEFCKDGRVARELARVLSEHVEHVYHPVTLAEIAKQTHPEHFPSDRDPQGQARQRRLLLSVLSLHARAPRQLVHNRRFVPLPVDQTQFSLVAQQAQALENACRDRRTRRFYAPCSLADHIIVAAAVWLTRRQRQATVVSGDKHQLEVAERMGLPWLYAREARYSGEGRFPWTPNEVVEWLR